MVKSLLFVSINMPVERRDLMPIHLDEVNVAAEISQQCSALIIQCYLCPALTGTVNRVVIDRPHNRTNQILHASCILFVPAFVYRDKREVILMSTFEITQYWWLLPLLMFMVCFFFCCKGCCRSRKNRKEGTDRNRLQRL